MKTRNTHGFGLALIIVGLLFLLSQFLNTMVGAFTWPLSIIVPGVLLLVATFMFRTSVPALAIPLLLIPLALGETVFTILPEVGGRTLARSTTALVALTTLAFLIWLKYWNLLGWHF
jgi:uncharacterized membrane protein HdeD (DUF308 family)